MTTLSDLQHWLAARMVERKALHKNPQVVATAAQHLTGNERSLPVEQLEIYREQFWLRHTAALLEDYPGLSGILGQSEWEQLAESYLEQYPCSSWSLRDLGAHLPEHIARRPQMPHAALCLDMARLEWAYVEIFDAPELPPLDGAKLASIPESAWQSAQIVISPAVRLLQTRYPVVALRETLRDTTQARPVPIPELEAQNVLLFRDAERSLRHKLLSAEAFELLLRLHQGQPLGAASEAVAEARPQSGEQLTAQVGAWFAEWARLGVIADVRVS